MIKVRLKCYENTPGPGQGPITQHTVRLQPVHSDDKETPNHSFSSAMPSGDFMLLVTNPAAFDHFKMGSTYDVEFVEYIDEAEKARRDKVEADRLASIKGAQDRGRAQADKVEADRVEAKRNAKPADVGRPVPPHGSGPGDPSSDRNDGR